jgi:hypothetical protein
VEKKKKKKKKKKYMKESRDGDCEGRLLWKLKAAGSQVLTAVVMKFLSSGI